MQSITVSRNEVLLSALAFVSTLGLCLLVGGERVARACPLSQPPQGPWSAVWVDLKSSPPNIPMDLVSFYDRTSGFQFAAWAGLFIFALAGIAVVVDRSINYSRASRQTRLFMSLANDALVYEQPVDALRLAAAFPASPVAWVVNASLTAGNSGEFQFSTSARHIAATSKTADVVRGLAMLGAIAMTTPIVGAAAAVEGLIRCLRVSSMLPISSDVLQNWVADWLLALLFALALGFAATWAHRLLSAKANRLVVEMDRLSLAIISRIMDPAERPRARAHLVASSTAEIGRLLTRPLHN
jgi:MotA/TolQ/ExbB proton channel family